MQVGYQLQEALLQSFVFRGALVKEIVGEDHVGHPQAEEHHQCSAGVHRHGQADLVCAVCHANREAGAALLCVVDEAVTETDQIGALVPDGGVIQAVVGDGLNLEDEEEGILVCFRLNGEGSCLLFKRSALNPTKLNLKLADINLYPCL